MRCFLPLALLIPFAAAQAQDGLGYASYQHCWGGPNALAITPDLAVERLLVEIEILLERVQARREQELAAALPDREPAARAIRAEWLELSPRYRAGVHRSLAPLAWREVWPRTEANEELAARWYVHRRAGLPALPGQESFDRFAAAVFGPGARAVGDAPFAPLPEERSRWLASLTQEPAQGVIPRLLQAIGEGTPELGDAAARRDALLTLVEHWQAGRAGSCAMGPGWTILAGRAVFVVGAAGEWQAFAEACERWRVALQACVSMLDGSLAPSIAFAVQMRDLGTAYAEVVSVPEPRPLSEQEAWFAASFVSLRDTLRGVRGRDGAQSLQVVPRTLRIGRSTVGAFVLDSTR